MLTHCWYEAESIYEFGVTVALSPSNTVCNDVCFAGKLVSGGLARLFSQVPTHLDEVEDVDCYWTGSNSSTSSL